MTLQFSTRRLFPCAPFPLGGSRCLLAPPRRWLYNFQLDGSFLAPFFRPVALDISLHPSFAQWLPTAPCTFVFNPATLNPPLLLVCYNHVWPGSQHLCFALGTVNPRLERNVAEQNDSAPFLHNWMFPLFCFLIVRLSSLVSFSPSSFGASFPLSASSFFLSRNTRPWHFRAMRALSIVSCVIGLLFLVPTLKNTGLEPSIEACWRR